MEQIAHADGFFNPLKSLCRAAMCVFKRGSSYLFRDFGHYSHVGSSEIVADLDSELGLVRPHS
jgi:hypothetical protein